MAQWSFPFSSLEDDRKYSDEDFAKFYENLFSNGVMMIAGESLRVTSSVNNGMTITVLSGGAVINGRQFYNTEAAALPVPVASTTTDRTDSVVVRLDLFTREIGLVYKQGDVTVLRQDTTWEIQLARIFVPRNAAGVTPENITDKRADKSVCGYSSPYREVPVSGLEEQYQDMLQTIFDGFKDQAEENQTDLETLLSGQQTMFQDWFLNLQNQLDDNQAANLQNQISKLTADKQVFAINHGLKAYPQVLVTAWNGGLGTVGIGEPNWTGSVPETIPAKIGYPSWNEIEVSVPVDYQMIEPTITETEPNSWLLAEGMKSMRIRILGGN